MTLQLPADFSKLISCHFPPIVKAQPYKTIFRSPRERCFVLELYKLFPLWQCTCKNHKSSSFKIETKTKDKLSGSVCERPVLNGGQEIWAFLIILVTLHPGFFPVNARVSKFFPECTRTRVYVEVIIYTNSVCFDLLKHIMKYLKCFSNFIL